MNVLNNLIEYHVKRCEYKTESIHALLDASIQYGDDSYQPIIDNITNKVIFSQGVLEILRRGREPIELETSVSIKEAIKYHSCIISYNKNDLVALNNEDYLETMTGFGLEYKESILKQIEKVEKSRDIHTEFVKYLVDLEKDLVLNILNLKTSNNVSNDDLIGKIGLQILENIV